MHATCLPFIRLDLAEGNPSPRWLNVAIQYIAEISNSFEGNPIVSAFLYYSTGSKRMTQLLPHP